MFLQYSSQRENYYSSEFEVLIYNHFNFWEEHLDFLKLLYKNNLMFHLFKQYQKYVTQLNGDYLKSRKVDSKTSKYANALITGIFWSMLYTWLENGAAESPNELAAMCLDLFKNKVTGD